MASIHEYLNLPTTWPIKENIKHEIVLLPNARDIKTAKRGEPLGCALRNAACRLFDVPNCAIGGRWAYIPQRDPKGKMYIARVQAPAETQRAIKKFDKTGKMPIGGFRFIPVAITHRSKYKRDYMRAWIHGEVGHNRPDRKSPKRRMKPLRSIPNGVRVN